MPPSHEQINNTETALLRVLGNTFIGLVRSKLS